MYADQSFDNQYIKLKYVYQRDFTWNTQFVALTSKHLSKSPAWDSGSLTNAGKTCQCHVFATSSGTGDFVRMLVIICSRITIPKQHWTYLIVRLLEWLSIFSIL